MSDFRKLEDGIFASPQIDVADIAQAKELGVTLVINNRPEEEEPGQTPGAEIEAAAGATIGEEERRGATDGGVVCEGHG